MKIGVINGRTVDSGASMMHHPLFRSEPPRTVVCFDKEIDELVASLEESAAASEQLDINSVYRLLRFVTQQTDPPLRYQRPDVLGALERQIYVQATSCRRRVDSRHQGEELCNNDHYDRWVNGGGKRAVVRLDALDGRVVQRRAGRIARIRNPGGDAAENLRYHQYSIESSYATDEPGQKKRVRGGVTLYHIYTKKKEDKTSAVAAAAAAVEKRPRERAAVVRSRSLDGEAGGGGLAWLDGPKRVRTPSVRLSADGDL